ncbi:multiple sugar transport system substrate-binding protein [Virgibacillus natechei]|uniref:Multiple sugar transport system substrate-binding protein n=1 Tax=Virgibacillus natechei TaxID=1216297 RepID=A0ABS4IEC9_9BACI|nr:extracellular solute-binding protein [Virgibacillus natechei]MBP1969255.1 multiple sugar transport system substrate-binding protein [Virgibacillus natechei]UZD12413.1 extracellular solute-binding protein [Virgibacillus natechei]
MKNKRWFLIISILTLSVFIIGCAEDSGSASDDSDDGNGDDDPVTINVHTHGNEATYNWDETIAAFEDAHPDIEVNLIILSESGDTQEALQNFDLAASSGEEMDVIMFPDPASYSQRVDLGLTAPLDEFIEEEGYEVTEEYKVDTTIGGEYHALPGKFNPWYVILNKDHLDEAGLEVPTDWTWDEFQQYAKDLTTEDHYGTYFHGPQNGSWMEYLSLHLASKPEDTSYLNADGSSNLDDPLFRETLELRYEMEKVDESATPYTEILSSQLDYRQQLFQQNTSTLLIGSWMNTELGGTDQFPLDFDIAVAPYPKNEADGEGGYTPVTTDFMSLAANSENKEAAYDFIRWYTTEGQLAQGANIPSWNEIDDSELAGIIDDILAETNNPEKVDKESLINVITNSQASKIVEPSSYQAEVFNAVSDEYESLIYDEQDIDETIDNAEEKVEEIISENQ